jgi:HAD domain in Swiss Army Knife RNA repair proteins
VSTPRPVLAIDVDGVLNAFPGARGAPGGWRDAKVMGFRIRHNPLHGERLLAIAAETGAELAWCTTWEKNANEHIAPLVGLPELPWVPMAPGVAEASRGLKFNQRASAGRCKAAALRIWAGDRPACWLDDEPDAGPALAGWTVPHLVIRVREDAGLQEHHLNRAARFLRGISGREPEGTYP